jgi:hypothetical protein
MTAKTEEELTYDNITDGYQEENKGDIYYPTRHL